MTIQFQETLIQIRSISAQRYVPINSFGQWGTIELWFTTNLLWLSGFRKEELRKRGDFLQNSCRSSLKRKELGFPRLIRTLIPLTILWYRNLIQSHFNFNYINNDDDGTMLTIYLYIMQVPPKPEPRQCTKPEPFQLESLMRHEEEMQREMEERRRMEEEEAQMRIFKAQPVLKE